MSLRRPAGTRGQRRVIGLAAANLAELAGIGCIVAAGWLLAPWIGLLLLGIGLIVAANFAGASIEEDES